MVGQTFGRYHIVDALGAGGMGVVYRAHDERLNRDVAVKVLAATAFDNEEARARFRREAMALARLSHPNIASIQDFDTTKDGLDLLVMEFVPGTTLSDKIKTGPLPEKEVLQLGRQLMLGLAAAHEAGIVHRDLKPGNIRITPDGRLKILDFGLSKELRPATDTDSTALATADGQVLGTLPYMAPEQLRTEKVDARTDIHAAGAVLYEMATGRRPFVDDSNLLLAELILNHPPVPPRSLNARVSAGLEQVILKALAKDPEHRYQTATEAAVDLERIALARTQTAGDVREPARKPPARVLKRGWFLGLSASSIAIAGIAVVLLLIANRPALSFSAREWVLLADFENLTGDSIFDKSLGTALGVSLSQSTYANVFSRSRINTVLQRMGKKPDAPVDEQVGREVCQRENIRGLICPSISKVGTTFVITARIVDPQTGDAVRSYVERAEDYNHILPALDVVAASVRKGLGESMAQVQASSRPLAQVTTKSLAALRSYSEAQQLWTGGQHEAALELQESAVKEDPDFAMAHAGLGVYYASFVFNDPVKAKAHFEKSLSLADRTTDREKMMIRLQYESQYGTPESARTLYETHLRAYPDSVAQRYNYAGLLRDNQELDKAVQQYKEVIRQAPEYASAYINLATTYSGQNKNREALATYDLAFKLEPTWITSGNLNHEYGFSLASVGEYDKARSVFTQGLTTPIKAQALRSLALLDLYLGNYREAKPKLTEALLLNVSGKSLLSEARNHLYMSILFEGEGDAVGVQRELDRAAKCLETLPPQPWLSARIAVGFARGRNVDKAARVLAQVRKDTNSKDPAQSSDLHRLEGEVEFARGNQARGLELLALADRERHGPLSVESLARAQRLAGKTDEATGSYEILLGMGGQSDGWEPQQSWFHAHADLAKLYLARSEGEKARRILQQLMDLWKAADPDLPVYKEARRLLGGES